MAFHMAFAVMDMRRPLHASLLAADTAPASGGSTRATAPAEVVDKLWHASDARGEHVRLDETDFMRALSDGRRCGSLQRWQAFWCSAWIESLLAIILLGKQSMQPSGGKSFPA